MDSLLLAHQLRTRFGEAVSLPQQFRDEVTLIVTEPEKIADVCVVVKNDLGFDYLKDISSIDNYGSDPRWTVVYHVYGYGHRCHLRLKTDVSEAQSELPTVTSVWRGADWHEREIYDMMGIRFRGHPDLRRILMWEGYPYFPLRKDFPLAGKESAVPEVAFSKPAPMEGGPFVTTPGAAHANSREPRAKQLEPNAKPE